MFHTWSDLSLLSCLDVPRLLALGLSSWTVLACLSEEAAILSDT